MSKFVVLFGLVVLLLIAATPTTAIFFDNLFNFGGGYSYPSYNYYSYPCCQQSPYNYYG
jgi:hypothetical protein